MELLCPYSSTVYTGCDSSIPGTILWQALFASHHAPPSSFVICQVFVCGRRWQFNKNKLPAVPATVQHSGCSNASAQCQDECQKSKHQVCDVEGKRTMQFITKNNRRVHFRSLATSDAADTSACRVHVYLSSIPLYHILHTGARGQPVLGYKSNISAVYTWYSYTTTRCSRCRRRMHVVVYHAHAPFCTLECNIRMNAL